MDLAIYFIFIFLTLDHMDANQKPEIFEFRKCNLINFSVIEFDSYYEPSFYEATKP